MAFTYGFFNSLRGDRKYNAEQVSEIFDGILADGIIPTVGGLFAVTTANNGMQINIASGRAWFNHTWSKNDSTMILTVPQSDVTRPRYDAVVLEVNHEQEVRANAIKIVSGVPAVNTVKPTLINTEKVHQYPLAYILVPAAATTIKAENIENMVGRTPTVFATGILETAPLDDLWAQWQGEWETWFASIKLQLSGDVVTNLQYQIDQLKDSVKQVQEMIKIEEVTHTKAFTSSAVWTNDTGAELNISVLCFGAGGGCVGDSSSSYEYGNSGGGGGGNMNRSTVKIAKNESVNITVGIANQTGNGGTTSFGSYCSANGGSAGDHSTGAGGSGGTGGGATYMLDNGYGTGNGGAGSYGGGGGGCGGMTSPPDSILYAASKGGNGGTYGGGGGGGGGVSYKHTNLNKWVTSDPGSGGTGGMYGGNGGTGGSSSNSLGYNGQPGISTTGQSSLEFTGPGYAGSRGNNAYDSTFTNPNTGSSFVVYGGAGGGGGGGYGGTGGSGSVGIQRPGANYVHAGGVGGCGGGGGGYGAKGGNAGRSLAYAGQTDPFPYPGGGGGGGGYGGVGKDATTVTGNRSSGGGGGGYGLQNYGSGRTSHRIVSSVSDMDAKDGICIITYVTRELIVG